VHDLHNFLFYLLGLLGIIVSAYSYLCSMIYLLFRFIGLSFGLMLVLSIST